LRELRLPDGKFRLVGFAQNPVLGDAMHWPEFMMLLGKPTAMRARSPIMTIMGSPILIILTFLIILTTSTVAPAQDVQDADEAVPSGIEIPSAECGPGVSLLRSWAVVTDKTASSGIAVKHTQMASTEEPQTLAICQSGALKNSDISVRFKVLHGAHGGAGVAFRLATPEVYYLVKIDARRNRAMLLLVNNGAEEEIVAVDADVAVNAWHSLAVRAQDDRFTVYLDGTWTFTGYDKTLAHAGRIALWAEPGGTTLFDRITIGPSKGPPVGENGLLIGTYTFANGDKYVGEMNYGAMHGHGTYTFGNGDKYVGEFRRGQRTGKGTYTYSGGDKYVGEFVDGKHCGQGVYTFANGNQFAGEFKDGKFNAIDTGP
jgi:hypothetical protein